MNKKKRIYLEDLDDENDSFHEFFGNECCNIKLNKIITKEYHIYLTKEIKSPDFYINFLKLLETSDEEDIIIIHINSPGGEVDTTIQIITAMKQSKAKITTEISSIAHSGASMIFLAGSKYKIHNLSSMLCHYWKGGIEGKGNEIKDQAYFNINFFENFVRTAYKGFLTPKEINQLIEGKDFWLNAKEIMRRLNVKIE